jgi:hypothetical protein
VLEGMVEKDIVLLIILIKCRKARKFMSGKPVAEQEIGFVLLQEATPKLQCQEKIYSIILVRNLTVKQVKVLIWT